MSFLSASCIIQSHLQQALLFQSEVSSKYIADDDKLWRDFAIWATTHWTIDLETTDLIFRTNKTVRHIISTKLCTGLPINAAQWSLVRKLQGAKHMTAQSTDSASHGSIIYWPTGFRITLFLFPKTDSYEKEDGLVVKDLDAEDTSQFPTLSQASCVASDKPLMPLCFSSLSVRWWLYLQERSELDWTQFLSFSSSLKSVVFLQLDLL